MSSMKSRNDMAYTPVQHTIDAESEDRGQHVPATDTTPSDKMLSSRDSMEKAPEDSDDGCISVDDYNNNNEVVCTHKRRRRTGLKILASVSLASLFFILGRVTQPLPSAPSVSPDSWLAPSIKNTTLHPLGPACPYNNWRQAKAQGCVYDLMLSSWLHPACHHAELYAQYREWMGWRNVTFWREREMIHEVPYEEAETGEHEGFLYAQGMQHHLHCSYVWARQRWAEARTPKVLDTYCRNEAHVDHCVFFNAVPFGWEIVAPNVTKIYQPYDVECLVDMD